MADPTPIENGERRKNIDQLLVDVFKATGQKLTPDDPIVVAALFQSSLLKTVGREVVESLRFASQEAIEAETKHAANFNGAIEEALEKLKTGAKKVTESELSMAGAKFNKLAAETLESVKNDANSSKPGFFTTRLVFSSVLCLVFGAGIGAMGASFIKPPISNEQLRLIHNGILLDAAWPKLPKAARETIQPPGQLGSQSPTTAN